MLLNPSHSSERSRVAPRLLDIYVKYKQFTRAVISWLITQNAQNQKCLQTVSIRDLLDFAEAIKRKRVVMPDTIDFQFREAIAARTQLSEYFRSESPSGVEDQETINHEYFTKR